MAGESKCSDVRFLLIYSLSARCRLLKVLTKNSHSVSLVKREGYYLLCVHHMAEYYLRPRATTIGCRAQLKKMVKRRDSAFMQELGVKVSLPYYAYIGNDLKKMPISNFY